MRFRIYDVELGYVSSPIAAKTLMTSEMTYDKTGSPVVSVTGRGLTFELDTGLTDRRDNPIYEGDILEVNGNHYPVVYKDGRFTSTDERLWLKTLAKEGRVVGNIHNMEGRGLNP